MTSISRQMWESVERYHQLCYWAPEVREEGIRNLDEAVALEPETVDAYIFRGLVARELQGDLGLAIEMYQEALKRSPPQAMQPQLKQIIDEMRVELDSGSE